MLFTVAGMVPFKPYFLGDETPPYRAGHVGPEVRRGPAASTTTSTTSAAPTATSAFFEMLGNFSFGDYFKAEAIPWAWELVTEVLGLDPTASGSPSTTPTTRPSRSGTTSSACPPERIQRLGDADNFWQMGDTGPCGPCSEIFCDHGPEFGPDGGPADGDEDRFVEIWNLVFMQFDQRARRQLARRCRSRASTPAPASSASSPSSRASTRCGTPTCCGR